MCLHLMTDWTKTVNTAVVYKAVRSTARYRTADRPLAFRSILPPHGRASQALFGRLGSVLYYQVGQHVRDYEGEGLYCHTDLDSCICWTRSNMYPPDPASANTGPYFLTIEVPAGTPVRFGTRSGITIREGRIMDVQRLNYHVVEVQLPHRSLRHVTGEQEG